MSTLSPNASLEDIEDELIFQQTLLDSLGPEVGDDEPQRTNLVREIAALESRLQNVTSPSASGESPSALDTDSTSISGMISTASAGSKRPGEALTDGSLSKRPALDDPRDRSWSLESIPSTQFAKASGSGVRYMERHRQAEEAARRRRAQEKIDQELAMNLSQGQSPPQPVAGPSRPSTSVQPPHPYDPKSHAPIFNPSYGRPPPPSAPVKPERVSSSDQYLSLIHI